MAGDGLRIVRRLNQCESAGDGRRLSTESAGVGEKRLWLTGLIADHAAEKI